MDRLVIRWSRVARTSGFVPQGWYLGVGTSRLYLGVVVCESHVPVVCDDSGRVGRDVGGVVTLMAGRGPCGTQVTPASPLLATSLWRGPGPVDRGGWLRHRVAGSYPTTLAPHTVCSLSVL